MLPSSRTSPSYPSAADPVCMCGDDSAVSSQPCRRPCPHILADEHANFSACCRDRKAWAGGRVHPSLHTGYVCDPLPYHVSRSLPLSFSRHLKQCRARLGLSVPHTLTPYPYPLPEPHTPKALLCSLSRLWPRWRWSGLPSLRGCSPSAGPRAQRAAWMHLGLIW